MARTGDVWLFRGTTAADVAIRTFTNAPVNHVGMAVVLDDLPPLLWHAELGQSLPDVWTGARHRGVQLHDLRDAVTHGPGPDHGDAPHARSTDRATAGRLVQTPSTPRLARARTRLRSSTVQA